MAELKIWPKLLEACHLLIDAINCPPSPDATYIEQVEYEKNLRLRFEYMVTFVEKIEATREAEARKRKMRGEER